MYQKYFAGSFFFPIYESLFTIIILGDIYHITIEIDIDEDFEFQNKDTNES